MLVESNGRIAADQGRLIEELVNKVSLLTMCCCFHLKKCWVLSMKEMEAMEFKMGFIILAGFSKNTIGNKTATACATLGASGVRFGTDINHKSQILTFNWTETPGVRYQILYQI